MDVLSQVVFAANFNIVVAAVEPVVEWDLAAVLEIASDLRQLYEKHSEGCHLAAVLAAVFVCTSPCDQQISQAFHEIDSGNTERENVI